jgi:GAF domain-containing protein
MTKQLQDPTERELGLDYSDELTAAMSELASLLVDEIDLGGMLDRIVTLAARSIPDCDSAGVTLLVDGRPSTAAATDQRTLAVDLAQYDHGTGPCLQAYRDRAVQRVNVVEAAESYPDFAAAARRIGVRSFLAAPLLVRGSGIGALNLYAADTHGFAAMDEAVVMLFAGQAAVAVANSRLYQGARTLSGQLQEAMASRAVIEQAKGVLMATFAIDADKAFDLLRQASQVENRKLRVVAADVVDAAASGRPVDLRLPCPRRR